MVMNHHLLLCICLTCLVTEQIWAPSPSTERGLPTQLSSDPKGEKLAYAVNTSLELTYEQLSDTSTYI